MTDSEDEIPEDSPAMPQGVGPQLRAARERKGLTLDQVASQTRISRRHLEHIEAGEFSELPGRTYAVGFARTYAKTVDLDQEDVVAMVRSEMDVPPVGEGHEPAPRSNFEPGEPSRAPAGRLLWFSLAAAAILLVGIFFAARALFSPAAELPSLVEQQQQEEAAAQAAQEQAEPIDADGAVVFTAEGEAWVRFYTADGTVLREGTLRAGDSFTVPANVPDPQLITGRPDLLAITIGGQSVRKLSTEIETLQDVPISAAALLARPGASTASSGGSTAAATPTPSTTPTPSATVQSAAPRSSATTSPPAPAPTATAAPTATTAPEVAEPPESAATAPPRAEPADPPTDGNTVSPDIN